MVAAGEAFAPWMFDVVVSVRFFSLTRMKQLYGLWPPSFPVPLPDAIKLI